MRSSPYVLVAGGAHIEVLSRIAEASLSIRKMGRTHIEVGGVAANIALNLVTAKYPTALLTAFGRNGFSSIINQHLQTSGIKLFAASSDSNREPSVAMFFSDNGDLKEVVEDAGDGVLDLPERLVLSALDYAEVCVIDCALPESAIGQIANAAHEQGVPIVGVLVSENAAMKVRLLQNIADTIIVSDAAKLAIPGAYSASALDLSRTFGCNIAIVRESDAAVSMALDGALIEIEPRDLVRAGNGAGIIEAFAAATVALNYLDKYPFESAVRTAIAESLSVYGNVNGNHGNSGTVERTILDWRTRAMYDEMTGLLNRKSVDHGLELALERVRESGTPLSLLIIDLDRLKSINDTIGHHAGDQAIIATAQAISRNVSRDQAGRLGGDEFLVFLPGMEGAVATVVARSIAADLAKTVINEPLTVSIGGASYLHGGDSSYDLKHRADMALYEVKRAGRNGVALK